MRFTALLTLSLTTASFAFAEPLQCADPLFRVEAETPDLIARTCESAAAGRRELLSCGITLDTPIEITVVDEIEGTLNPCLGVYHCGENQITLLSPKAMARARLPDSAFAGVSELPFWNSVMVHELTHAAYDKVKCPFSSCVASSEYAAYAMQVRSLPPEEQERFGKEVTLKSKPSSAGFSAMIYFMAPDRFAKSAWLHFQSRPDPCGYLSFIMNGDIFFDMEPL
ncbi:MAG: hypothetical protein QNJ20_05035 [Paracoccaceae bacterium]|nr:hypothetical protein [Paracoccaceae bacterium]